MMRSKPIPAPPHPAPRLVLQGLRGPARALAAGLFILLTGCVLPRPVPVPPVPAGQQAAIAVPAEPAPGEPSPPEAPVDTPEAQVDALVEAIARVSEHGLDPEDYGLSRIRNLAGDTAARGEAARAAWLLAATHLAHGRLDQDTLLPRRTAGPAERAMLARLDAEGGPRALAAALDGLAPQHPEYLALRAELARQFAAMAAETDPAAVSAHAALIGQLRVNLERWRWLPRDLGPRYVLANIAGFDVTVMEHDTVQARHTAIFGKTQRETPAFSDEIEYIIFNPWWEVPDSIARADKLPQFRRDPGVIKRLGYKILDRQGQAVDPSDINWADVTASSFPYRIRQAPGPHNALGQVKIMFPNPHNVYLHDTPDRDLFESEQRTFSSGCIRVQQPLDLAEWLLADTPGWDRTQIDAAVASGSETRVDLLAPVPVYVVYLTAVDDFCGGARYLPDIYGRDAPILKALQAPAP